MDILGSNSEPANVIGESCVASALSNLDDNLQELDDASHALENRLVSLLIKEQPSPKECANDKKNEMCAIEETIRQASFRVLAIKERLAQLLRELQV